MPKSKCLNIVKVLLTLSNVVVYDLFIYNESYWQFFSVFFCNRLLEYSFEQFAEPPPPSSDMVPWVLVMQMLHWIYTKITAMNTVPQTFKSAAICILLPNLNHWIVYVNLAWSMSNILLWLLIPDILSATHRVKITFIYFIHSKHC